ncbi:MAG: PLDc N-terminal domain-containing protein, partial [Clostridia bacterium]|nr:PLDc N-terminal domain-containing protein [Clostridia bacterium]
MYPLFHRRVVVLLALLIQILLLIYMHLTSIAQFRFLYLFSMGISVLSVLFIITRQKESAYKLPWIMLIAMMPAFGGLLFVFVHAQSSTKRLTRRFDEVNRILAPYCPQNEAVADRYAEVIRAESQRSHYLTRHGYPIYAAEAVEFLPSGEDMFARLCEELRRAEHFIFMEYFIVAAGEMWDEIHAILLERVAAGVEVRLIYDDMGSFFRQPYRYDRTLCAEGIDTILFNPFRPAVSALQNNRDHRKITVIDGRIAFTGGINLGDEYINRTSRFGRWNDTAVAIE